jgi:MoxR-like ATPase
MASLQMLQALRSQLATVIVGQHALLDRLVIALLAGGHVLLEGPQLPLLIENVMLATFANLP